MSISIHQHTVGDTLSPMPWTLQRSDGAPVNLSGLDVKFRMVAEDGTVVVDDDDAGIAITSAAAGEGQYDFQAGDVETAGVYYAWLRVVDPVSGECDTYPSGGRRFAIVISEAG
jgi:hypothetical protein